MLVDQKVKKFTELLACTLAMYDCRQFEDVSSIEHVYMVTEKLSQIFIRCCHLHLPSLSSLCHMHLVHLNSRTTLHDFIFYVHMLTLLLPIPPCNQLHQQFLHGLSLDHQITRSSFVQQQLWAVCSEFRG